MSRPSFSDLPRCFRTGRPTPTWRAPPALLRDPDIALDAMAGAARPDRARFTLERFVQRRQRRLAGGRRLRRHQADALHGEDIPPRRRRRLHDVLAAGRRPVGGHRGGCRGGSPAPRAGTCGSRASTSTCCSRHWTSERGGRGQRSVIRHDACASARHRRRRLGPDRAPGGVRQNGVVPGRQAHVVKG